MDSATVGAATLAFLVVSGVLGYAARRLSKIDGLLSALDDKIDKRADGVTDTLRSLLDTHERRDQERHEDTIQRLTRAETLLLNGHGAPKRKRTLERA